MNAILQLRLLGTPEVTIDQSSVTERLSGKAQAALYYLAVTGQPQSRPVLAGLLWGDVPEAAARANLRRVLVDLRQIVGDYLEIERQSVGFTAKANVWADVVDLTTGIEAPSFPVNVERLQQAVELYRGDFLAGFYVRKAPDFESWAAAERERLREMVIQALYTLADYHIEQGELAQGVASMRRLLSLEPWREEAHRQLMLLLARSGQRSAALAQFETCQEALAEELGVEPGPETVAIYERIRDGQINGAAGEPKTPIAAHNLPPQPTAFVGRDQEVPEVGERLSNPACRLVSIVGPGGIGKTRLSVEVARQALAQFADGVYFVSLAGIDMVEDIIPRLTHILKPTSFDRYASEAKSLDDLGLSEVEMLLVLDNFEQLLPDGVEALQDILTHTSRLKLIVTCREALNIRWEWRFDLAELSYPEAETVENLESYSAVQLFLQIARRARPQQPLDNGEIRAAIRICRLLGGMPLGIELAAAQVSKLSCATMANALEHDLDALATTMRDIPERQRSLRAIFDYSWLSLPAEDQQVLKQLSIFRGGFTVEVAEAVAGASLATLINLVDKSLLRQVSPERYNIHEVLRRFAEEKLAQIPDDLERTRVRCHDYYAAFLQEKTEALSKVQDVTDTLMAINAELENLWAVWRWDLEQDEAQKFGEVLDRMWLAAHWIDYFIVADPYVTFEEHRQWLEAQSSVLRVIHIDIIWLDALAEHLRDLGHDLAEEARQHFPVYIDSSTVFDKLVAFPYFANVGLLYYRADLLTNYGYSSPPTTWEELETMATRIQAGERAKGHANFWGYVWQGKKYEGLTCNALEWQVSHRGGQLIEPAGLISVNNPQAIAAFERAARWVGTISPVDVTDHNAWDSWKVWLAGNAAFIRNWGIRFYDPKDMKIGKDGFGVTRLPSGQAGHAATLGGSCIAMPVHTQYLQEALALTRLAARPDAQKQRALTHPFYPPTIPNLYDDPEILAINPHFSTLKSVLTQDAVLRPSKITGKLYPQVSEAYFTAVHSILTGHVDAATAVAEIETKLVEITGFRVGQP